MHVKVFRLRRQNHHTLNLIGYVYNPEHLSVILRFTFVDFKPGEVYFDWRHFKVPIPLQFGINFLKNKTQFTLKNLR
jgi:hypothetical protein